MPAAGEEEFDEAVTYEPISVKELLIEIKDTSELLIDLAYSAILHNNDELAQEVLKLEEKMDILRIRSRMSLLLAARNPDDAEQLAPVLGIVAGAEKISNAAGDIANIVLRDIRFPEALRAALPEAVETVARGTVDGECPYLDQTLEEVDLERSTGVRVIAIRRGDEWLMSPGPEDSLHAEDVAILRGPREAVEVVYETLTGQEYTEPVAAEDVTVPDFERAVDSIVLMKNLSELAVDLAYSSVLFDNAELAEEVDHLEVEMDALRSRFEAWILKSAAAVEDPVSLRGLIHLGVATETISDAAIEISEGVLHDIEVHPVTKLAVQESDEVMTRVHIDASSELSGTNIENGVPEILPSINVLIIRRPGEGWLPLADGSTVLQPEDVVIAKGTSSAVEEFNSLGARSEP